MILRHTLILTVIGPLLAAAGEHGLLRLAFLHEGYEYRPGARALARALARAGGRSDGDEVVLVEDSDAFAPLVAQLGEYFCGRRRRFDLPLDLRGTPFQLAVWKRVARIPYGQLRTYKQVAGEIGRAGAARAVGQAVGDNPVGIIVPCHRVIGSGGDLVGFGGGMTLKEQLLRLEGHTLGERPRVVEPRLF